MCESSSHKSRVRNLHCLSKLPNMKEKTGGFLCSLVAGAVDDVWISLPRVGARGTFPLSSVYERML